MFPTFVKKKNLKIYFYNKNVKNVFKEDSPFKK